MSTPRPPEGTGDAGRRLWRDVLKEYTLTGADMAILRDAVVMEDQLASLEALIRASGPLIRDGNGQPMANPASVQHRLLSAAKAKCLASIRVVGDDAEAEPEHDRPQRRVGFRGPQRLRVVE